MAWHLARIEPEHALFKHARISAHDLLASTGDAPPPVDTSPRGAGAAPPVDMFDDRGGGRGERQGGMRRGRYSRAPDGSEWQAGSGSSSSGTDGQSSAYDTKWADQAAEQVRLRRVRFA